MMNEMHKTKGRFRKPNLFLAGKNIDVDTAKALVEQGKLLELCVFAPTPNKAKGTSIEPMWRDLFYIEHPADIAKSMPSAVHQYYLRDAVSFHFELIQKRISGLPSPIHERRNYLSQQHGHSINFQPLPPNYVIGVISRQGKPLPVMRCQSISVPVEFQPLLTEIVDVANPPIPSSMLSHMKDAKDAELARDTLAGMAGYRLNAIAQLGIAPSTYYDGQSGLDHLLRNYIRNSFSARNMSELVGNIKELQFQVSSGNTFPSDHPVTRQLASNLSKIQLFCKEHHDRLEEHLFLEGPLVTRSRASFHLNWYEKRFATIVELANGDIFHVTPNDWAKPLDIERTPSLDACLIYSLLPELKREATSLPVQQVAQDATRLIGNFWFQPDKLNEIMGATTRQNPYSVSSRHADDPFDMRFHAPMVDYLTTRLDDSVVFEGRIDDVPHFDDQIGASIEAISRDQDTSQLSGMQIKLAISLSEDSNGIKTIRRQDGNMPFTHIAKFPMTADQFRYTAIAEWLGLTMARAAGLEVPTFQLVNYYSNPDSTFYHVPPTELPSTSQEKLQTKIEQHITQSGLRRTITGKDIPKDCPPFIIIERFDIPDITKEPLLERRIAPFDFAALLNKSSNAKYDCSMEQVAGALRDVITDPEQLNDAFENLFLQSATSVIVQNNDLHLKNLTLLKETVATPQGQKTRYRMSPTYDVLITTLLNTGLAYDSADNLHQALPTGTTASSKGTQGNIFPGKSDLINWAVNHCGLTEARASELYFQAIDGIEKCCRTLQASPPAEFASNRQWLECLQKGTASVLRNINHLRNYQMTFGVTTLRHDERDSFQHFIEHFHQVTEDAKEQQSPEQVFDCFNAQL